jgi:hypothetical protein
MLSVRKSSDCPEHTPRQQRAAINIRHFIFSSAKLIKLNMKSDLSNTNIKDLLIYKEAFRILRKPTSVYTYVLTPSMYIMGLRNIQNEKNTAAAVKNNIAR